MNEYIPLAVLFGVVVLMAAALPVISSLFGRRRPSERKLQPYECGISPELEAMGPVSIKFSVTAMLFLVFDIEVIFLYPWAAAYGLLGWFGLLEMVVFIAILVVGYVYVWNRGAFEWDV